jgi:predicted enzyme related to lactoylglutathione lyase
MAVLHDAALGQVALTADKPAELAGFYRETLGLPFLFDAGGMYFFSVGGVRLMIGPRPPNHPPGNSILYFKVADIAAAHTGLGERGVKFLAAPHRIAALADRDLWLAEFTDPVGNALALMAEIPRRQPE